MNLHQSVVALQFEKGITVICSLLFMVLVLQNSLHLNVGMSVCKFLSAVIIMWKYGICGRILKLGTIT